ncbi:MAG TPA: glycoside hydrolase family 30 beta sandwich domain-containing protein, partial [Elusimicrobiota bacterium]|nr:glycoside hydrolase family 30 beta sandwich domain-containing protein [Elusimicrobiota bacterium]
LPDNAAFLNPDGSLVLIVQADRAGTFDVEWNGQHFTYDAPAKSTITFKWSAGIQPGPTVTPAAAMTPTPLPTPVILDDPGQPPASDLLLDFETTDGTFSSYNADALSGELAHSGAASLWSASTSGEWHTVGANFSPVPLNLTAYQKLCFWVYDTTDSGSGLADNTIAIVLTDSQGNDEEHWTDHAGVGVNPKTIRNEWVQMCFNLSAFPEVDLSRLLKIEFTTYWAGDVYFDEVTVEK